jgi:hypothetical protein
MLPDSYRTNLKILVDELSKLQNRDNQSKRQNLFRLEYFNDEMNEMIYYH